MRTLLSEELAEFADSHHLTAAEAQRDYVAVRVAHAIASDPGVGESIALKGGFVLRYGYGSPRTSKDIDGTIGTKRETLAPKRLQRVVRGQCSDLSLRFDPRHPTVGVDSLDFGNVEYVGPIGRGVLTLELSYREDLLLPARRPGDAYDLWFLWDVFRTRAPRTADDIVDADMVKRLVPRKVALFDGLAAMVKELNKYKAVWAAAKGDVLPLDAPGFGQVEKAVLAAARAWTPWR